jgi:hypothetical protein
VTTCQYESRCAGRALTDAIDHHVQTERHNDNDSAALLARRPGGPPMPRKIIQKPERTAGSPGSLPDLRIRGAGDENRTRIISLGIRAVTAGSGPDLATLPVLSDRG